jgi:hypothetical protein
VKSGNSDHHLLTPVFTIKRIKKVQIRLMKKKKNTLRLKGLGYVELPSIDHA